MSTVRRLATPSRHARALLALLAALPPVLHAVDVCDEEGICVNVDAPLTQTIQVDGVLSAYWPGYAFGDSDYRYRYILGSGSRLDVAGSPDSYYSPLFGSLEGEGVFRLISGRVRFFATGTSWEIYDGSSFGTFVAQNTHTGGTELAGGILSVEDDAAFGAGPLSLGGISYLEAFFAGPMRGFRIEGNHAWLLTRFFLDVSGAVTGPGRLNLDASTYFGGVITLSGANTHEGGTYLAGGFMAINADNRLGAADTALTLGDGATVIATAGFSTSARELVLSGSTGGVRVLADTLVWNGLVSGPGSLVKQGPGTLALTQANTFAGGIRVEAGAVAFATDAALGAADAGITVLDGATLRATAGFTSSARPLEFAGGTAAFEVSSAADTVVWTGAVFGPGALAKTGPGTLVFSGGNTSTGGLHIAAGTFRLGADDAAGPGPLTVDGTFDLAGFAQTTSSIAGSGSITLGGGALTVDSTDDSALSATLSGPGAFTKAGSGTLTLEVANPFSGTTSVSGGVLRLGHAQALAASTFDTDGAGSLSFGSLSAATLGGLAGSGPVSLSNASSQPVALTIDSAVTSTYSGSFTGAGSLVKRGAQTFTLAGAATHTGYTTVRDGTFKTAAAHVLSAGSAVFINNHATLDLDGHDQTVGDLDSWDFSAAATSPGKVKLGGATLTNLTRVTNNWAGSLTGSGTFVKQGSATMNWSGANTFAGLLRIDAGKVSAHAADTLSPSAIIRLATGATLELNDHDQTIAGLSGEGGAVALGSATLAVAQSADSTFAGVISGAGALAKSGPATLELSGDNTYAGGTAVSAGTLRAGHVNAFGSGGVEISGGTVDFNGFAIANNITNRGGTLTGLAAYAGTQTIAGPASFTGTVGGSLVIASAASLDTTGATFTGPITVQSGGTLTGTGTLGTLTVAAGGTLSPGDSPGLLTIGDGSILEGTTLVEIGGLDRGTGYDAIDVRIGGEGGALGSVTVGGTLDVVFWGGWTPDGAASFEIFRASSFGGTFAQINLPAVGAGYSWSTDRLLVSGHLDLVASAIPEPASAAALAGLGLLGFATLRRRRRV